MNFLKGTFTSMINATYSRHLSVYRYVDTSILGEKHPKRDITEVKDEYGLWDELGSTYLFRPDVGLSDTLCVAYYYPMAR